MKTLTLILALTLAIPANAGGLVIEEEYDVAEPQRVNPLVILGAAAVACLILCRSDDDAPVVVPGKPEPVCFEEGC